MRYYIPTTTRNLNNILASESISPAWMYPDREQFANPHWSSVDEQPCDEYILLYSKPGRIRRTNQEEESYPLLIEIEVDRVYPALVEDIYYTDETIYLYPSSTRFLFEDETHRSSAFTHSDSSLETKLTTLYRFVVESSVSEPFIALPNDIGLVSLSADRRRELIEHDQRVNKLKGLLYGFYIGAMLSREKLHMEESKLLRKLGNLTAMIISRRGIQSDHSSEERFGEYLDQYKGLMFDCTPKSFRTSSGYRKVLDELDKRYPVDFFISDLNNGGEETMRWLAVCRDRLDYRMATSRRRQRLEDDVLVLSGTEGVSQFRLEGLPEFLLAWFNEVFLKSEYTYRVSGNKKILLADLVTKAKEYILSDGKNWDSSPLRAHLNDMRRVAEGEEAHGFDWSVVYTTSLLAVVERADDWQKICAYLEDYGLTDFRLAFAYYGVLCGFAKLTRDFTDILYMDSDKAYLSKLYAEIHGQLHGESIECNFDGTLVAPLVEPEKYQPRINQGVGSLESSMLSTLELPKNEYLAKKIRGSFENLIHIHAKDSMREALERCLSHFKGEDVVAFMVELNDYEGWGKNLSAWRKLLKELDAREAYEKKYGTISISEKKVSNDRKERYETKMFSEVDELPRTMLEDISWWDKTAELVTDPKARQQYLKDVKWFVGNYSEEYKCETGSKKGEVVRGKFRKEPRDNESVLGNFKKEILSQEAESREEWVRKLYKDIPDEDIFKLLKIEYGK